MKKQIIYILLFLFFAPVLNAQEKLNMGSALKKALEHNFQVKIKEKELEQAKNNNAWGAVGRYPKVDFQVIQDNKVIKTTGDPETTSNSVYSSLSLNWLVFDGFKIGLNKEIFEYLEAISKESMEVQIQNTIYDISINYNKSLLEKEKLGVFLDLLELSRDRYYNILERKELGGATTFEMLQLKNAYLRDSSSFVAQELNYSISLRELNYLMGESEEKLYILEGDLDFAEELPSYDELKKSLLETNLALKVNKLNQDIQNNNLQIAKNAWYPTLSFSTGYDYSFAGNKIDPNINIDNEFFDYYAKLIFSINLYNGGNTDRAIENAMVDKEIADFEFEDLKLQLENNLSTSFEMYSLRKQLKDLSEENFKAAILNLNIAQDKFKNGTLSSFNFRDIQMVFLNASIDRLEAIYNLKESYLGIQKLIGQLKL